jgi:hypothetical protein
MRVPQNWWLLPALVLLTWQPGCGQVTGEVTGRVTMRGKPVSSGSVILFCPGKRILRGVIGKDGCYSISGVPLGDAVVTVRCPAFSSGFTDGADLPPAVDNTPQVAAAEIPARYAVPEESGLTVRVGRGRVVYDIDLAP